MDPTSTAIAIGIVLLAGAIYVYRLWRYQFIDCWCCKGAGVHRPKDNKRLSRRCRWCGSTGKRLRIWRRARNAIRRRRA